MDKILPQPCNGPLYDNWTPDELLNKVYEEAKKGRVYTYGPIIHNEEVVKDLENKGVKVINSLEEFQDIPEGTVVIRSHGVAKEVYDFLKKQDLSIMV